MIAPLIVTPIALWFGWHGVFLATGFFGLLWLVLWRKVGATVDTGVTFSRERLPFKNSALWAYILLYGVARCHLVSSSTTPRSTSRALRLESGHPRQSSLDPALGVGGRATSLGHDPRPHGTQV